MSRFNYAQGFLYYQTTKPINPKAPWIVLLNGVMSTTSSWQAYRDVFAGQGFNVLTHNYRNQPLSSPTQTITFEEHSADLYALLKHLDIKSYHLVGVSYGGIVALTHTLNHPSSVKTLNLIATTPMMTEHLAKIIDTWSALSHYDGETFYQGIQPFVYHPTYLNNDSKQHQENQKAFMKLDESYYQGQRVLYKNLLELNDFSSQLERLKQPTVLISGVDDIVTPMTLMQRIQDKIIGSELLLVPNTAHGILHEKTAEVVSVLLGFILKEERKNYERS